MIRRLLLLALNYIVSHGKLSLFSSPTPIGARLGGHDVVGVKDSYICLTITIKGLVLISWHWQTT